MISEKPTPLALNGHGGSLRLIVSKSRIRNNRRSRLARVSVSNLLTQQRIGSAIKFSFLPWSGNATLRYRLDCFSARPLDQCSVEGMVGCWSQVLALVAGLWLAHGVPDRSSTLDRLVNRGVLAVTPERLSSFKQEWRRG